MDRAQPSTAENLQETDAGWQEGTVPNAQLLIGMLLNLTFHTRNILQSYIRAFRGQTMVAYLLQESQTKTQSIQTISFKHRLF